MKAHLVGFVFVLAVLSPTLQAQTWANVAGGNWNTASNWSPATVPTASSIVTLGALANPYTVVISDTRAVNTLTSNSANATLNQTGTFTANTITLAAGTLNFSAGTLTINTSLSVGTLASATWSGGQLTGSGTLSGIVFAANGGTKGISGVLLQNGGTLAWIGGTIFNVFNSSAALTNTAAGIIDLRADGTAFDLDTSGVTSGGILYNFGTIQKTAGSPLSSSSVNWAVQFGSGGKLSAAAGTTLNFNFGGTLSNGTTTTSGAGTVALANGDFTIPSGATFTAAGSGGANLNWTQGSLVGPGTLAGTILKSGNRGYISGSLLQNRGTIAWISGAIQTPVNSTSAITNLAAGVIDLQADGVAFDYPLGGSPLGTIFNSGTIQKLTGNTLSSSNINWGISLGSTGLINVQSGILYVNGSTTLGNGGTLTAAAGASIFLNGGGTLGGTTATNVTGSGTVAMTDGTFTVAPNITFTFSGSGGNNLLWIGGTIAPNGVSVGTIGGTLFATSGNGTKIIVGTTLNNGGTIAWTGGPIYTGVNSTSILTNLAGATIDLRADGIAFDLNSSGGSPSGTLYNAGTLLKSAGSPLASSFVNWSINFVNGGTLTAATGTILNLNGGGTLANGTTTTTGAGLVALRDGSFSVPLNAVFTAAGNGGANLNWTTATLTGSGTLAGTLIKSGGNGGISGTTLQNGGLLAWQSGVIQTGVNSTSILTNLAAGVIDLQADGIAFDLGPLGGTPAGTILNSGTIRKSAGSPLSSSTIVWAVNNSGTVNNASPGQLYFMGVNGLINTGTVTMANGATIGGTLTSNSGGIVRGPAAGTANYAGALTFNNGSTLQPGDGAAPGKIQLNSTLTMNSGSTYSVRLAGNTAGTGYSQVQVTGQVSLSSTTLVIDPTGFTPDPTTKYVLILNDSPFAINGTFSSGNSVAFGNYSGLLTYTGDASTGSLTGGNDLILYSVLVLVPEPTGLIALFSAAVGLLTARRKWKSRNQ